MDAIEEVNIERHMQGKKGTLNPKVVGNSFELDTVEFDVAVMTVSKDGTNAEGGIAVLGIKVGAGGKSEQEFSNASRVKFSLGVAWPYVLITDVSELSKGSTSI